MINFPLHSNTPAQQRLQAVLTGLICLMLSVAWIGSVQAQGAKAPADKQAQPSAQKHKKKKSKAASVRHQRVSKTAAASGIPLNQNPELTLWAQDAAKRLELDPDWLEKILAQSQRLPLVEKLVLPPSSPVAKDWGAYRARFIEPVRIQAGQRFWRQHQTTLARAEREYGVPAAIIVGIIGVETLYGQNTGNFRVVDA